MEQERETVVVSEKKSKIEAIKKKYENMQMSDETAQRIQRLEMANNILKAAAVAVGILTVIDFAIPDPIIGADEAILTGITTLFTTAAAMVDNKIKDLAVTGTAEMKNEEAEKLSGQLLEIAKKAKSAKQPKQQQK